MEAFKVYFKDGREMVAEPGATFTGINNEENCSLEYVCFTDHRQTGPVLARKKYVYYFKIDPASNRIIYSDNDDAEEVQFVAETLGEALDCPAKGLLCLFELVRGGIERIKVIG